MLSILKRFFMSDTTLNIEIRDLHGNVFKIKVPEKSTVGHIMKELQEKHNYEISHCILVYASIELEDDYEITNELIKENNRFVLFNSSYFPQKSFPRVSSAFDFHLPRYFDIFTDPTDLDLDERSIQRQFSFLDRSDNEYEDSVENSNDDNEGSSRQRMFGRITSFLDDFSIPREVITQIIDIVSQNPSSSIEFSLQTPEGEIFQLQGPNDQESDRFFFDMLNQNLYEQSNAYSPEENFSDGNIDYGLPNPDFDDDQEELNNNGNEAFFEAIQNPMIDEYDNLQRNLYEEDDDDISDENGQILPEIPPDDMIEQGEIYENGENDIDNLDGRLEQIEMGNPEIDGELLFPDIELTQQEIEIIRRLGGYGYDPMTIIQVFRACDQNEDTTLACLMSMG
ncbi:hypothetical protein TRFO_20087 [Tritrichomonas foetus]|uniref:Ubiquitin-like domain-containing protein n=1 Tax=Tritrichomonas foetus TaxID=1144522 RepID=A0A1J4KGT9_9EUKA|nr:hypothetical protein TRFO_20087 [Tritrichomonas foetus]|eukprot:OHT10585.1 hypothetical protein TRFO_20087 [Tritrichomonas foetus]